MANPRSFSDRIKPIIGINIGLLAYFAWMFAIAFAIFGSTITRTILFILLVYQYCFAKKSEVYLQLLRWLAPFNYFDKSDLILEEPLKTSKSLFCYHPHGILAFGFSMSPAFSDVIYDAYHLGSRHMINIPISGIFARWMGLVGVDKKNFQGFMEKGKNMRFLPGGFEEATITNTEKNRVYVKRRKGFIKYALKYGYTLYPCYTFNENKIYNCVNKFEGFRLFLNKIKIPGTWFYGKYIWLPRFDIELITVIGKALELPVIEKPTKEEIKKYHGIYVDALKSLFDKYKERYGITEELEIL
jgi:2-acylglycerol O-acyltransferase 2